jgi:hypothetical protein
LIAVDMELSSKKEVSTPAVEAVDPLAKERDLKFKKWLQNKAVKEKAFEV